MKYDQMYKIYSIRTQFYNMDNKNSIEVDERCINVSLFHLFGVRKQFNVTRSFFPSTQRFFSGINVTK